MWSPLVSLGLGVLLPGLCWALQSWPDGQWYDAPKDFNVGTPICKAAASGKVTCESDHFFNGSCYYVDERLCEWREAVELCKEVFNAGLVSIASAEENSFVRTMCGQRMCWLGLTEVKGLEDQWRWLDGAPAVYWNWHEGEPSNFGGRDENVVIMNFGWKQYKSLEKKGGWADGDWYDVSRVFNKPSPICKRPAAVLHERSVYCDDGWDGFGSSCYHLLDWNCSYAEATMACEKTGAKLVSITDEEEQIFVTSLCGPRMCWLGIEQDPISKVWQWVDGSKMVYAHWEHGEPNNYGGHESVAIMNFDASWIRGKNKRWQNPMGHKTREAFFSQVKPKKPVTEGNQGQEYYSDSSGGQQFADNSPLPKERSAASFRLGSMVLFAVVYMAAFIVLRLWGKREPGGPLAVAPAVLIVVLLGDVLDHCLWRSAGATNGILIAVGLAEGAYLSGAWSSIRDHLSGNSSNNSEKFDNNNNNSGNGSSRSVFNNLGVLE